MATWRQKLKRHAANIDKGAVFTETVFSRPCLCLISAVYHTTFSFIYLFIFISWRLITLQYCSGFCHTLTWINHGYTCIPHSDPPSPTFSFKKAIFLCCLSCFLSLTCFIIIVFNIFEPQSPCVWMIPLVLKGSFLETSAKMFDLGNGGDATSLWTHCWVPSQGRGRGLCLI